MIVYDDISEICRQEMVKVCIISIVGLCVMASSVIPLVVAGYKNLMFGDEGTDLSYTVLEDDLSLQIQKACTGAMPAGEVIVTPPGIVLTKNFKNYAKRISNFKVRESDTWVISFPKCGTTWLQEMVWLLKNNINFERALKEYQYERFPFLEWKALNSEINDEPDTISIIDDMKSPRLIKTHMPIELLPRQIWTKNPKIIYVARNPKDAALSYINHYRFWNNYKGSQELFLEAFLADKVVMCPFWDHVLSYWKLRQKQNFLFITFENMKKDLAVVMRKVADFLEVTYTDDQKAALLDHLSLAKMKVNKAVNFEEDLIAMGRAGELTFMREGKVGGWKEEMSPKFITLFEQWTTKHLEGTDFPESFILPTD